MFLTSISRKEEEAKQPPHTRTAPNQALDFIAKGNESRDLASESSVDLLGRIISSSCFTDHQLVRSFFVLFLKLHFKFILAIIIQYSVKYASQSLSL